MLTKKSRVKVNFPAFSAGAKHIKRGLSIAKTLLLSLAALPGVYSSELDFSSYQDIPIDTVKSESSIKWVQDRIAEIKAYNVKYKTPKKILDIEKAVASIKGVQDKPKGLKGTIGFNYSNESDKTTAGSDLVFGANIDLTRYETIGDGDRATFNEFRIKLDFSFTENSTGFKEDVGTLLLNWDQYIDDSSEWFVFSELFQADPVGVSRRWEVGVGYKYSWRPFSSRSEKVRAINGMYDHSGVDSILEDKYWENSKQIVDEEMGKFLGWYYGKNIKALKVYHDDKLKDICKGYVPVGGHCKWQQAGAGHLEKVLAHNNDKNFRRHLYRETEPLEASISVAMLREFLDPTVSVTGRGTLEGKGKSFNAESNNNIVLSIRPKIIWGINDQWSLTALHFFKKRVGGDKLTNPELRKRGKTALNDYGSSEVSLAYKASNKVTLSVEYHHFIENEPFTIPEATVSSDSDIIDIIGGPTVIYDDALFNRQSPTDYEKISISVSVGL